MYGTCDDFDTFLDELHIYQDKIILLKIFNNRELSGGSKKTFLSVSNFEGKQLWKTQINNVGKLKLILFKQ